MTSLVNVAGWVPEQVAMWLNGVSCCLQPYLSNFIENGITGKHLLNLTNYDLINLNIVKIGHQEIILKAVSLLQSLLYDLESETLTSIALRLECRARNLSQQLKLLCQSFYGIGSSSSQQVRRKQYLDALSYLSDVIDTIKVIVNWLDRLPPDKSSSNTDDRGTFLSLGYDLISLLISDGLIQHAQEVIEVCGEICKCCTKIITESKNPIVIQPAYLSLATIRKKPQESLGFHFHSSHCGVHTIARIKVESSAAAAKINKGDEIIQINYQTIVGWNAKSVSSLLLENKSDVVLTLKKAPRHIDLGYTKRRVGQSIKGSTLPKALVQRSQRESKRGGLNNVLSTFAQKSEPDIVKAVESETTEDVFQGEMQCDELTIEPKVRRATVCGGSPPPEMSPVSDSELEVCRRPKSFMPQFREQMVNWNEKTPTPQNQVFEWQPPVEKERRQGSDIAARQVASTGAQAANSPMLVRFSRIDSKKRAELADEERSSVSSVDSDMSNYSIQVIGGLPQKVPTRSGVGSSQSLMSSGRRKKGQRRHGVSRRISCKDLGKGDCQGWLWKKREGVGLLAGRWLKYWFVLKNKDLFFYKDPDDIKAQGLIHLPGYTLTPVQDKFRKFAFKAYHHGTVFYFAAERQDDMAKWLNKMQLASLNFDTSQLETTAGFRKPGSSTESGYVLVDIKEQGYFTESDDDGNQSCSSATGSVASSREDLTDLYKNIRQADLDLAGADVKAKPSTVLRALTVKRSRGDKSHELSCRLLSLKRTLKDKESKLSDIEDILHNLPNTSEDLGHFRTVQLTQINTILTSTDEMASSSETESLV